MSTRGEDEGEEEEEEEGEDEVEDGCEEEEEEEEDVGLIDTSLEGSTGTGTVWKL